MANKKTTRRALWMSVISLILCCAMLTGTTFAWFTDEVSSTGNIIKSGTLDAELNYWNGTEWQDASTGTLFNYDYWEPGYTQIQKVQIKNAGNLAFRFRLNIVPSVLPADGDANLADVINVYLFDSSVDVTRDVIDTATPAGTLSSLMNDPDGAAYGVMLPTSGSSDVLLNAEDKAIAQTGAVEYTIALKMQEEAGNEYQNTTVSEGFKVQLLATQYTYENDSFDNMYDEDSAFNAMPTAKVKRLNVPTQEMYIIPDISAGFGGGSNIDVTPEVAFTFDAGDEAANIEENPYKDWLVDYYVSIDKTVADGLVLIGSYGNWQGGAWYGFNVPAGTYTEPVGLLGTMSTGGISNWTFAEIVEGVNTFNCGAADNGSNEGATMTVELRIMNPENPADYKVVSSIKHTFGGKYETLDDGTELFYENDGSVTLYDTANVTTADYSVPAGVTKLGNYAFANNSSIETVTLPSSVTDLRRGFDSNTSIKKVVLNEGLTTISSRAFKSTTALEEVVISSTITTIADNAFQKSGIKNIVIPANVETIGETAFGASLIESVTIEGNTSIQGYAFRGCTALRTVNLNGDDVTFIASTLNGRNSTWFCNSESNNPNTSNITFNVVNDTVAARVKTAMGAEANNTPVYVNGTPYAG